MSEHAAITRAGGLPFQALSGQWIDLTRPTVVLISDIAHHLAMICRWNGSIPWHYSVAQHAWLCSHWIERHGRRRGWSPRLVVDSARDALHHDDHEFCLGDVGSPLKHSVVMEPYRAIEDAWDRQIRAQFELAPAKPWTTSLVDRVLAEAEQVTLKGWEPDPTVHRLADYGLQIRRWSWRKARRMFMRRSIELELRSLGHRPLFARMAASRATLFW